jgi:hypothetical protein
MATLRHPASLRAGERITSHFRRRLIPPDGVAKTSEQSNDTIRFRALPDGRRNTRFCELVLWRPLANFLKEVMIELQQKYDYIHAIKLSQCGRISPLY